MKSYIYKKFESYISHTQAKNLGYDNVRNLFKEFVKDRYDDIFKGKKRIYIPFKSIELKDKNENISEIKKEIEEFLEKNDYEIINYIDGLCKKRGEKNKLKIGKVLNKLKRPDLVDKFNKDKTRIGSKTTKKDLMIVISRHPIDIVSCSTNRGWTSCMDLKKDPKSGEAKYSHIKEDIKEGVLVAYLTTKDDKNINSPIARVSIKPYKDTFAPFSKDSVMLFVANNVYGENIEGFRESVKEWLIDNNLFDPNKKSIFKISGDIYVDDYTDKISTFKANDIIKDYDKYSINTLKKVIEYLYLYDKKEFDKLINNIPEGLKNIIKNNNELKWVNSML